MNDRCWQEGHRPAQFYSSLRKQGGVFLSFQKKMTEILGRHTLYGGRVMLSGFDGGSFTVKELHRFTNDPVAVEDTMYWDVLRLFLR